jgi:RNA polymerase sigma-70 factor, ECF subfamily
MINHSKAPETLSITALRSGDRAEFARLVEQYSTRVYYLALKMLGDGQDAEDVLQETFLKAFRSLANFEGRSSLATWLYRIAINESLMHLRRSKPDTISIDSQDEGQEEDSEPFQIVDWSGLPEEKLMSAESRRVMDRAIEKLTPALRAVFLLRDVEGLSIRETSEALGLNEAVIKTRLSRARFQLRQAISVYFRENQFEGR